MTVRRGVTEFRVFTPSGFPVVGSRAATADAAWALYLASPAWRGVTRAEMEARGYEVRPLPTRCEIPACVCGHCEIPACACGHYDFTHRDLTGPCVMRVCACASFRPREES